MSAFTEAERLAAVHCDGVPGAAKPPVLLIPGTGVDAEQNWSWAVPYAWRLENLFVVNTGTVSSLRLRGNTRPCYNLIEVSGTHVDVWRRQLAQHAPSLDEHACTYTQSGE